MDSSFVVVVCWCHRLLQVEVDRSCVEAAALSLAELQTKGEGQL